MQPEIYQYFKDVADKYDILKHVHLQQAVESAEWDSSSGTWIVTIRDLISSQIRRRRCKVLISAVGALSIPKKCDIPGSSSFQGRIFHTAEWDHSFDWKGKDVVVIGTCGVVASSKIMLINQRKWMQRHASRPCDQRRRSSRQESHPVQSPIPLARRQAEPKVLKLVQVDYAMGSFRHANISCDAVLGKREGFPGV